MIKSMLTSAVFAGFAAGLLATLLHFSFVQQPLLLAEQYESGSLVHSIGGTKPADTFSHDQAAPLQQDQGNDNHGADEHAHGDTVSTLQRNLLTAAFAGLIYAAYALILVAGFGLATSFGHRITMQEGLIWGIAGFVAFQMAPAMGLAPELPGTISADLGQRQIWWWSTVATTATGLAMLGYGRTLLTYGLGVALLAAPHVFGAPVPDDMGGAAPPELAAGFAARVLGVALVVWSFLGATAGYLWEKTDDQSA